MATKPNRTTLLKRITRTGREIAQNVAKGVSLTWLLAEDLVLLQGTYPAGKEGAAAFKAAAATASQKGETMIANLVRAHEVRESLTKAQRDAVAGWSYDAVLTLSGKEMTSAKRTSLITKAAKKNTQNVKVLRGFKADLVGKNQRSRKSNAEVTTALVKALSKDLERLFKNHPESTMALIAGARLAQDNAGKDVASAISFYATQAAAAAKVVKA